MGVQYDKSRNKYRATVTENGKRKYIGQFDTKRKASNALAKYRQEQEDAAVIDLHEEDTSQPFFETERPTEHKVNLPKPSLMSRIKAKLAVWQKKLNEL